MLGNEEKVKRGHRFHPNLEVFQVQDWTESYNKMKGKAEGGKPGIRKRI